MVQLVAGVWYGITGRCRVATFGGIDGFDPRPRPGQQVEIDGKEYTVLGVETPAISDATGRPFGLLVVPALLERP